MDLEDDRSKQDGRCRVSAGAFRSNSHPSFSRVDAARTVHRRRLVATRSMPQWKTLTQVFTECLRRRACLSSLVHFSGYGVNFCMQRYFSESDHMTYWISCALDRKRYMAVRAPNYNAERLLGDDNLWHWALLDHPHVLSVLAVAAIAPGIQVYLITLAPEDGLEHFTGIMAVRDLCVHELHLRKFLCQLCSTLVYLRASYESRQDEDLPATSSVSHHRRSSPRDALTIHRLRNHLLAAHSDQHYDRINDRPSYPQVHRSSARWTCTGLVRPVRVPRYRCILVGTGDGYELQRLCHRVFRLLQLHLRRTDRVLNKGLVWNRRCFDITSLPGSLWSLLLRLDHKLAAVYAAIPATEDAATAFSIAVAGGTRLQ
ncbi:hypothetical protein HPB51_013175 [Rhipicephalus microplus]|uniref:Uncharacterized protein n=1 Tax=Rhipicephalus microplus TaxID=6941 RepID=A0A9J6E266_RHIMP|nr:hypothetical protein HPB51_013175 [Rhipicephalus microplus]